MLYRLLCRLGYHRPREHKQFYYLGEDGACCCHCGAALARRDNGSWKVRRDRQSRVDLGGASGTR